MSEERKVRLPAELLGLQPQEEALEVMVQPSKIYIGVPRERHFQENRISLTPEAVSLLVARGSRVVGKQKPATPRTFTTPITRKPAPKSRTVPKTFLKQT